MITLNKLRRKPRHFQKFTGLTVTEFERVLAEVIPAYEQGEYQRRNRGEWTRRPGAGRPHALALPERLLMGLLYLRLYCSQSLLSYLFDLDESNLCREFQQRLLPLLLEVLPVPLRALAPTSEDKAACETSGKKRKRLNTLQELLQAHPEFEALLVDATEQEVPQPADKRKRKQAFSGKQHDHTLKTQIVATKNVILHVFGGLPGSLHDMTVLRASGVLHQLPQGVKVRLDKGYQGADTAYPAVQVQQPIKKKRNHPMSAFGKAYNPLLSILRIPVAHHFARLQRFGCLAGLWRGAQNGHEDVFCIVSGLLNLRATGRLELV